jgi:FAD/FMN-containing dehydrogenase
MSQQVPGFLGRIVRFPLGVQAAISGMKGPHQQWFPISKADVATALQHAQNLRMFVKSGLQAAAVTDVVDASGSVVLNLADLMKVDINNGVVNVEPAANTKGVAESLAKHDLALPLADNPGLSIASNVLHEGPSCLMRTLGSLTGYVTELDTVTPTGQPITLPGASALPAAQAAHSVITGFTFKPAPATSLWMFRKSFPYPGKDQYVALAKALFMTTPIPKQSDLVLDAFSARHDMPVVRITAVGSEAPDKMMVASLVGKALAGLPRDFAAEIITEDYSGSAVIKAVVDGGYGIPSDPGVATHRVHQIAAPGANLDEFLGKVADDINRGLAFRADRTGKLDTTLRLFVRVQLNRDDRLELSGLVYTHRPVQPALPGGLTSLNLGTREAAPLSRDLGILPAPEPRIPGFRGDVYIPSDPGFAVRATQYATSSFPEDVMTPFMLAYPLDQDDIAAAITFARSNHKHVAARSGGHQYCGMSSGGDTTIVVAMDAFNQLDMISENVVEVGPSVRLTELAARFKEAGITIPHGECPLVGIGGHAQTGGYGHLLRGFGLALDHVVGFTIVLADGTVRTIERPAGPPGTDDDELFWGVLGGNAGSFGIVIKYRIECIKDVDHPNSYGFSAIRKYDKARYTNLMKIVQTWTRGVVAGTLPPGIDFMMTVESRSEPFLPPVHLVELVHSNLGGSGEVVDGDQVFNSIIQASDAEAGPWLLTTDQGPESLSTLSDSFVRRYPKTTLDGREFKYPYKKRVNGSTNALTDVFVERFIDMVDKGVTATEGVYLVFQMIIGGGELQSSSLRPATSIPRRDLVFGFAFDLFYDTGYEEAAVKLQDDMQGLVDAEFSATQEQRFFWGSFGDTDMTHEAVVKFYYDDINTYSRSQNLKKRVDPDDLFHTPFTVKLP